jgi:ATP-binding cassette subfamily B multidrug efflux pump
MMLPPARRLLGYIARYRRQYLVGLACGVVAAATQLAGPWVLKYAIDDLLRGVTTEKVRFYAIGLLALAVFGGIFRFLVRRIVIGASRSLEYDLRNDFFAHLQQMPLAFFQERRTGDLMSRATNDLSAVRMMAGPAIMYTSNTSLTFLVAIALMLSIDAQLTLIALIPLPFVSISVRYFGAAIHRRFERIQEQLSDVSAVTQEALAGVRVVRAYGQERAELERFRGSNEEYVNRNKALIRLQGAFYPSMGLLMGLSELLVLWIGSRHAITGRITVGELVAFNAYLMMLSWPMIAFGWVTNMLQRGMASWKRMLEIMDTPPAITDPVEGRLGPAGDVLVGAGFSRPIRGEIELRSLTFRFGNQVVLDDVSAIFPAGKTTAIVGATGSGKSTLLALLPRLHDPPPATVFLDGVDVRDLPLTVLRGAIGFVPQEPFLFSDTIAENIAFGARDAQGSRDRIVDAGRIARLDKDLADFPKGYDTVVGERGITLSGGQKQRTAIARALAVDPKILILDDALSAVDTYTEEEILSGLREVMRQRTSIIVSHRISTVRDADQILVLDKGRIVERGRHDDLVARDGLYAELYRKQLLEEELAAS